MNINMKSFLQLIALLSMAKIPFEMTFTCKSEYVDREAWLMTFPWLSYGGIDISEDGENVVVWGDLGDWEEMDWGWESTDLKFGRNCFDLYDMLRRFDSIRDEYKSVLKEEPEEGMLTAKESYELCKPILEERLASLWQISRAQFQQ